jgi:hypothetical protein
MKSIFVLDMDTTDGPATPADPSPLLPQIIRYVLSVGQAANLPLDSQFMNAECCAHEVVRLMESSSTEQDLKLSIRSVTRAFKINHSAVKRVILSSYEV